MPPEHVLYHTHPWNCVNVQGNWLCVYANIVLLFADCGSIANPARRAALAAKTRGGQIVYFSKAKCTELTFFIIIFTWNNYFLKGWCVTRKLVPLSGLLPEIRQASSENHVTCGKGTLSLCW